MERVQEKEMDFKANVNQKFQGVKMKLAVAGSAVCASVAMASPCFADEAINTAMTTALTGIKTDMLGVIAIVAPIGVAIAGVMIVWLRGIGFFKKVSK